MPTFSENLAAAQEARALAALHPTDQSQRVIFFRLLNVKKVAHPSTNRPPAKAMGTFGHTLAINPEDLTVTEPSRVAVQQTMGGAWVDSFGTGLRTINISGVTGWRPKHSQGRDWEAEFIDLHNEAFKSWHSMREFAISNGEDPDDIKLEFVDTLDRIAVFVVPQQFVLKRSKSRPLLVQYNIGMIVTADIAEYNFRYLDPVKAPDENKSWIAFEDGINNILDILAATTATVTQAFASVFAFIGTVMSVLKKILSIYKSVGSLIAAVVLFVTKLVKAAHSLCAMLTDITTGGLSFIWQQLAGAFNEMNCLFSGGLKGVMTINNYSDFNGASNCSSTAGGSPISPLSNTNGLALLSSSSSTGLPRLASAPESTAHKTARLAYSAARNKSQRDANAVVSAKRDWDTAVQFALDYPSTANTARATAKQAIYNALVIVAAASLAAAATAQATYEALP